MSTGPSLLDRLTIPQPCDADWDSMIGNDQMRFCEHCQLHVSDLSALTRHDALQLVARARGRICVRFIHKPGGGVLTTGMPEKLYRISRRVSRIAAGAFTATLSLSSAAAQSTSLSEAGEARTTIEAIKSNHRLQQIGDRSGATVSGTIKTSEGQPVTAAIIMLVDPESGEERTTTSSDRGEYSFDFLAHGDYLFWVRKPRFTTVTQTVKVALNESVRQDVELVSKHESFGIMGGAMVVVSEDDPLLKAINEGDAGQVRTLVVQTADINKISRSTGSSYLATALQRGNQEIISLLLAAGADPNLRAPGGQTALMTLPENATVDLVRDLISAGARVNARDNFGNNALMNNVYLSRIEVIRELIKAGTQLNATNSVGETVLFNAARNEDPEALIFLLAAGLNPNTRNEDGDTVLMTIAVNGKFANFKTLIDRGADAGLVNDDGRTTLMMAAVNEDPQFAKLLIEMGADVNAQDLDGDTALTIAVAAEREKLLGLLIRAGANVDIRNARGETALFSAARTGCVECVKVLIKAGADFRSQNQEGQSALAIARAEEREEIVELLKLLGARE